MFPLFALVDGGLGEWSDWSECGLTCGIGKQGGMGKQARNQDFMWGGGGGANETKVDQTTEMYFLSNSF